MAKLKIEDIRKDLEERGWKLISTEYKNLETELEMECPEGHKVFKNYKSIRKNYGCPVCKNNPYKNCDSIVIPNKGKKFRILALDQATVISGWSVFDDKELVKYGIISPNEKFDKTTRISIVKQWLIGTIDSIKPDLILFEDIQLQDFNNSFSGQKKQHDNIGVTTFKVLAELIGVLENAAYEAGVPFKIVHSATWRKDVGINGRTRADKKKSAQMLVKRWYDVQVSEDEADAICIGRYGSNNFKKEIEMVSWE